MVYYIVEYIFKEADKAQAFRADLYSWRKQHRFYSAKQNFIDIFQKMP